MFGVRRHRGIYSAALRSALRPPPAPRRCWAAAEVGPRDAPGRWGLRGLSGAGPRAPPEEGWERPRADGSLLEDEPKVEEAKAPAVGVAGYSSSISRWYNAPSTTTVAGRESLVQGLRTNVSICVVKGAVWCGTGSHVIFADWMHSIADVANYSYRLIELNRSAKQRDREHPYGYAPLRYITADRSFVFLGLIGGVYPISIGLGELYGGVTMCESVAAPMAVFVASALLEGVAVRAAYREILSQSEHERIGAEHTGDGPRRVLRYLQEGRDVMSTATFTEASCGILSAGIGLLGLGASWYLHSGVPDVVASIVMAGMVCGGAFSRPPSRPPVSRGRGSAMQALRSQETGRLPFCTWEVHPFKKRIGSGCTPDFPYSYCVNRGYGCFAISAKIPFTACACLERDAARCDAGQCDATPALRAHCDNVCSSACTHRRVGGTCRAAVCRFEFTQLLSSYLNDAAQCVSVNALIGMSGHVTCVKCRVAHIKS